MTVCFVIFLKIKKSLTEHNLIISENLDQRKGKNFDLTDNCRVSVEIFLHFLFNLCLFKFVISFKLNCLYDIFVGIPEN